MYKRILIVIITLLCATITYIYINEYRIPKTSSELLKKIVNVEHYKYYLDEGNEEIAQEMQQYDLIIIEPIVMDQSYIDAAKEKNVLVYGYINAMEGDKWNDELYTQFEGGDFYRDNNGNRMYFDEWDSYMMDIRSKHYQEVLLQEIKRQIIDKGLDGVFLDTVGNIDDFLPDSQKAAFSRAMTVFMKKIKQQYHGLSIAQNWGFETLFGYTGKYVDFIMWEDFSHSVVAEDEWALEMMSRLKKHRTKYGTQVMVIAFEEEQQSRALASQHLFKFYYNKDGSYYNTW